MPLTELEVGQAGYLWQCRDNNTEGAGASKTSARLHSGMLSRAIGDDFFAHDTAKCHGRYSLRRLQPRRLNLSCAGF